jgi:hypothetical protein
MSLRYFSLSISVYTLAGGGPRFLGNWGKITYLYVVAKTNHIQGKCRWICNWLKLDSIILFHIIPWVYFLLLGLPCGGE